MEISYVPYGDLKSFGYDLSSPLGVRLAEMCKRVEKLLNDIEDHFRDVPNPRITLHVARAYDDEWDVSQARGEELRRLDPEEVWKDVTKEKVETFQEYF